MRLEAPMRPTPKLAVLLAVLTLSASALAESAPADSAQGERRVIKIGEVSGDALGPGEATALRGLISSYVIERGGFRVIDAEDRPLSMEGSRTAGGSGAAGDSSILTADYVLTAVASRSGGRIALTLDIAKVVNGERKSVAEAFSDLNDLVLSSRRLTAALFDRAFGPSAGAASAGAASGAQKSAQPLQPEPGVAQGAAQGVDPSPRLSAVAGTWNGDKGIDSVSLRPDGRGFALLDSGARMLLKAIVSGSFVIVTQDQPNSPDFYRPDLDLKSARVVSAAARRWKWMFSLSADGSVLKGFKESVFVKVDEKGAVSVDNDYSREALWTRRSR
jgi:hypothetical protein